MCLSAIGIDSLGCELEKALSVIEVDDIISSVCEFEVGTLGVVKSAFNNCLSTSSIFFCLFVFASLLKERPLSEPALREVSVILGLLPLGAKIMESFYARHSLDCNLTKFREGGGFCADESDSKFSNRNPLAVGSR